MYCVLQQVGRCSGSSCGPSTARRTCSSGWRVRSWSRNKVPRRSRKRPDSSMKTTSPFFPRKKWVSVVWHLSLPLMNSFNKTEAAIFLTQPVLSKGFPFSPVEFNYWCNCIKVNEFYLSLCNIMLSSYNPTGSQFLFSCYIS